MELVSDWFIWDMDKKNNLFISRYGNATHKSDGTIWTESFLFIYFLHINAYCISSKGFDNYFFHPHLLNCFSVFCSAIHQTKVFRVRPIESIPFFCTYLICVNFVIKETLRFRIYATCTVHAFKNIYISCKLIH